MAMVGKVKKLIMLLTASHIHTCIVYHIHTETETQEKVFFTLVSKLSNKELIEIIGKLTTKV